MAATPSDTSTGGTMKSATTYNYTRLQSPLPVMTFTLPQQATETHACPPFSTVAPASLQNDTRVAVTVLPIKELPEYRGASRAKGRTGGGKDRGSTPNYTDADVSTVLDIFEKDEPL